CGPGGDGVPAEGGGGRTLGEACHIYDFFSALPGSTRVAVSAQSIVQTPRQWRKNDNFVATISYADGSICSLTYTSLGNKSFPKETMEVFVDGTVISMHYYRPASNSRTRQRTR